MKKLNLKWLLVFILCSCKPFQHVGGGSSGGGGVPTSDDLNDYIDRITAAENKTCGDVRVDIQLPGKYPIIYPSGKFQWKNDYSKAVSDQINKDYMKRYDVEKLSESDLSLLGCPGFNYASESEKKQFWILLLSSIAKPESNFNTNESYPEDNGTISAGLLQIDFFNATKWCQPLAAELKIPPSKKVDGQPRRFFTPQQMFDPKINLECGILMLKSQALGAPAPWDNFDPGDGRVYRKGQVTRQSLVGKIFTGQGYFNWSVLSDRNSSGKREVIDWFRVHAQRQLKFCNRSNPIDGHTPEISSRYKEMNCKGISDKDEKENCEKYLLKAARELDQTDPRMGENPVESSCPILDNTARKNSKLNYHDGNSQIESESSGINK